MDDLKLLSRRGDDLENEINIVKVIGKAINMNFLVENCARICFKKKVRVQSKIYVGNTYEMCIKEQDPREPYKYLGIDESYYMQHKNEKENLKMEYLRRFRLVLGTELSAMNKIQAIGSAALPVLRYSF